MILVSIDTISSIIKMLTKTQNKILSFLLRNTEEQATIRGIARRLRKSYTLVYNNLANLEKRGLIRKHNVPPAKVITLHEFAPAYFFIDIELKIRKEFLRKNPWVEVMLNDAISSTKNLFFILIVFGSYAKGTQTKKSDIDLLVIIQAKDHMKNIENSINKAYTKVKKNVIIVDVNDFMEMISHPNALNVGNEAKKHHVILYGVEQYYQIIKDENKRFNK